MSGASDRKVLQRNRRASFDYDLLERVEAGIVLLGSEVKSIREGKVSLQEAYGRIQQGEAWIINMDVQPYTHAGALAHEPKRRRKLLLHRRQIEQLKAMTKERGLTLIPTQLYVKEGLLKLELAVAKGRQKGDKRAKLREKEEERSLRRRGMKRG